MKLFGRNKTTEGKTPPESIATIKEEVLQEDVAVQKEVPPKVMVLVDYENIAMNAVLFGKVVDFEKLAELCRDQGNVIAMFIFVPAHLAGEPWVEIAYEQGFFVISSPSSMGKTQKQVDTADTMMIDLGGEFLHLDIDSVIIVTHDRDFYRFVNSVKNKRKKVILIHGKEVSSMLTRIVKTRYPVPFR